MIEIYKKEDIELKKVSRFEPDTWINVSDPSFEEIDKITEELNIPRDFITDPLDPDERSRIEIEDNVKLIIIRVPLRNHDNQIVPFITIPVGIILTKNHIITVCRNRDTVWDLLSHKILSRNFSEENRKILIFRIFQKTTLLFLRYLKEINHKIKMQEELFHETMKNEEIIKLLNIEKSLVYFYTSLKSNELVIEKLQRINFLNLDEDDIDIIEDIQIDNRQALEMSHIYSNILRDMMDAFSSVISNNLNIVMKTLTSITIILMLPTLVSSIYGMNIKLPLQDEAYAFEIILLISFILTALGIFILVKRKLF